MLLGRIARGLSSRALRGRRAVPDAASLGSGPANADFEIEIGSSGQVVKVNSGQTILEAAEHAGIAIPNLCRSGICGLCTTGVLVGAEHVVGNGGGRAAAEISVCVAQVRPGCRVVLDL